jgi:hypothetical protein
MHTTVRCLLLALLLSAPADDLWAVATPDPSDDLTATEDNEYTPVAHRPSDWRPRDTVDPRPVAVGTGDPAHTPSSSRSGRWAGTDARPFYCAELLYTLMSLQR